MKIQKLTRCIYIQLCVIICSDRHYGEFQGLLRNSAIFFSTEEFLEMLHNHWNESQHIGLMQAQNHGMKWLTSQSWTLPGKELWDCDEWHTVGWFNFELYTVSLILTGQCWITDSPFIWKKSNFQGLESILTVTIQWKNSTDISSAAVHSIRTGS